VTKTAILKDEDAAVTMGGIVAVFNLLAGLAQPI
jgi:hypothetical protein